MNGNQTNDPPNVVYVPGLDQTAAMTSMMECFTVERGTHHIPCFNGKDPPLREFLQDVTNGAVYMTPTTEAGFIKAVLSKLKGPARESVRDKQFNTLNELTTHLKRRFSTPKTYQYYIDAIANLRMKQTETVSDYNDRLQGFIVGAKHALEEKYPGNVEGSTIPRHQVMMIPIKDFALDSFIRGLPTDISTHVDTRCPRDISEALEFALHAEERDFYGERYRGSSYRIMKNNDQENHHNHRVSSHNPRALDSHHKQGSTENLNVTKHPLGAIPNLPPFQMPYPPMYYPYHPPPGYPPFPPYTPYPYQPREAQRNGVATPPRSTSPGLTKHLNLPPIHPMDASMNLPHRERPKSVTFQTSVGSLGQEPRPKTPPSLN